MSEFWPVTCMETMYTISRHCLQKLPCMILHSLSFPTSLMKTYMVTLKGGNQKLKKTGSTTCCLKEKCPLIRNAHFGLTEARNKLLSCFSHKDVEVCLLQLLSP